MNQTRIIAFWSPFPITSTDFCMDFFAAFFHRYGDIQCLNCQNGQDERTLQLLHHADLLVVILRQNHFELCSWLSNALYRFTNCLYMIIDYYPEKDLDLLHISREFRIPPSRLACIPYTPAFKEAILKGRMRDYWNSSNSPCLYQSGMNFHKEMLRSAHLILKALEEQ